MTVKARLLKIEKAAGDALTPKAKREAVSYMKAGLAALEADAPLPTMPEPLRALLPYLPDRTRRACLSLSELAAIERLPSDEHLTRLTHEGQNS